LPGHGAAGWLRIQQQETHMPDDRTQRGGQDRKRINVNQDHELRNWAQKFGVSTEELKRAVQSAGDSADAVEQHLKSRGASSDNPR
jgi:hypothetical protein